MSAEGGPVELVGNDLTGAGLSDAYARYGHVVVRRARALLGNDDDAEDLCHELFTSLLERPEQYRGAGSLTGFLYAATTHLAPRRLRDRHNRSRLVRLFVMPQAQSRHQKSHGENLAVLRDLLSRIDKDLAIVAAYVYVDELAHHEVAELMGCSRRTVGNLLVRFHEKARALLKDPASFERSFPVGVVDDSEPT